MEYFKSPFKTRKSTAPYTLTRTPNTPAYRPSYAPSPYPTGHGQFLDPNFNYLPPAPQHFQFNYSAPRPNYGSYYEAGEFERSDFQDENTPPNAPMFELPSMNVLARQNKELPPRTNNKPPPLQNQSFQMKITPQPSTTSTVVPKSIVQNFKKAENGPRILSGPVEKILNWIKNKNSPQVLFEVVGVLKNIRTVGPGQKILIITDGSAGPVITISFHEIDRPLPAFMLGAVLCCIGRAVTRNKIQAFKIREIDEQERAEIHRISFMCNRVAQMSLDGK